MDERIVTIRAYSHPWEADVARSALEAEGVPVFLADDQIVGMNWLYSDAVGGVKLRVPESHAEQAVRLLSPEEGRRSAVAQDEGEGAICPKCGSANTTTVQRGRKLTFLTLLLVGIPLF